MPLIPAFRKQRQVKLLHKETLSLKTSVRWHHRKLSPDSWLVLYYLALHNKNMESKGLMMMFNLEVYKQCNILATTPTHTRKDYNIRTYKMCLSSDGYVQIAKKAV